MTSEMGVTYNICSIVVPLGASIQQQVELAP